MLNPTQLSARIDRHISAGAGETPAVDIGLVTEELLCALDRDDRRGIDPDILRDRIHARSLVLSAVR